MKYLVWNETSKCKFTTLSDPILLPRIAILLTTLLVNISLNYLRQKTEHEFLSSLSLQANHQIVSILSHKYFSSLLSSSLTSPAMPLNQNLFHSLPTFLQ